MFQQAVLGRTPEPWSATHSRLLRPVERQIGRSNPRPIPNPTRPPTGGPGPAQQGRKRAHGSGGHDEGSSAPGTTRGPAAPLPVGGSCGRTHRSDRRIDGSGQCPLSFGYLGRPYQPISARDAARPASEPKGADPPSRTEALPHPNSVPVHRAATQAQPAHTPAGGPRCCPACRWVATDRPGVGWTGCAGRVVRPAGRGLCLRPAARCPDPPLIGRTEPPYGRLSTGAETTAPGPRPIQLPRVPPAHTRSTGRGGSRP